MAVQEKEEYAGPTGVAKREYEVPPPKYPCPKGVTQSRWKKMCFRKRLEELLDEYKNALIVGVDNVGSNQMQQVRAAIRGKGVLVMGKNTVIRKTISEYQGKNPKLASLAPLVRGNVGIVLTNSDLTELRKTIVENKVPAGARTGSIAPDDCFVPPGPTGLDPAQTSFFQALNILTKINRGSIEIVNKVHLIKKGDKVTSSEVALLTKLNIRPFFYGITVQTVWENGSVYGADVLDLTPDEMSRKFTNGVRKLAAISLALGIPTACSIPHSFNNAFSKLVAIAFETEYSFKQAEKYLEAFKNPGPAAAAADDKKEAKEEEKKEESEESSDGGAGGLFGDESESD